MNEGIAPRRDVAIVLAAGHARRFGADKLAQPFAGRPLLSHAIAAARAAPVGRVILVCRAPLPVPMASPAGAPPLTQLVIASDGLARSLAAGVAAARDGGADGAFVFLGDMPLVPHDMAARLAVAIGSGFAALPRCAGLPGHPVLLARRAFAAVMALGGDEGAGRLLRGRDDIAWVETANGGVLRDVDRPVDLAALAALRPPAPNFSGPDVSDIDIPA